MIGSDKSETIKFYPKTGIGSWVIKIRIMLYLISTTHGMIHQHNVYSSLWAYPSQMAQHWLLQYLVLQQSTVQISISAAIHCKGNDIHIWCVSPSPWKIIKFHTFYHNFRIMPIQLSLYASSPNASIPDSRKRKRNWLLNN